MDAPTSDTPRDDIWSSCSAFASAAPPRVPAPAAPCCLGPRAPRLGRSLRTETPLLLPRRRLCLLGRSRLARCGRKAAASSHNVLAGSGTPPIYLSSSFSSSTSYFPPSSPSFSSPGDRPMRGTAHPARPSQLSGRVGGTDRTGPCRSPGGLSSAGRPTQWLRPTTAPALLRASAAAARASAAGARLAAGSASAPRRHRGRAIPPRRGGGRHATLEPPNCADEVFARGRRSPPLQGDTFQTAGHNLPHRAPHAPKNCSKSLRLFLCLFRTLKTCTFYGGQT